MSEPTKRALITGASRGIGKHLAEHLLERGYSVAGGSRSASKLEHDRYVHYGLDVSDEQAVVRTVRGVHRRLGGIDVLINNAGIASMNHLFTTPAKSAREMFETNLLGTFLMCREVAKVMQKGGYGRIVNIVSVAVPMKLAGHAAYAASKAGVVALTEVLSFELARFGITVNALGPTAVKTDLLHGLSDDRIGRVLRRQAIPRMTELEEIAEAVDFFVAPNAGHVTGQTVYLGGV